MTYKYKEYEVKIKMVQKLKMKFLLGYHNCHLVGDKNLVGESTGEGIFPGEANEQIFFYWGDSLHSPSRKNPAWVGLTQYTEGACKGLPRKGKISSYYLHRMVSAKKCYIAFKLETISQLKHQLLTILPFPSY